MVARPPSVEAPPDMLVVQEALGYRFRNQRLLIQALTHRTWVKEWQDQHGRQDDQEQDQGRLELLGDAFLGYVIAQRLFDADPTADEGVLTERRKHLVEGSWLHTVGEQLCVAVALRLGRGEEANRWRNKRLHRDTVEALIGGVLVDGGESAARALISRIMPDLPQERELAKDPIVAFNELWQRMFRTTPPIPEFHSSGEDHERVWTATLLLPDQSAIGAAGASKQDARRNACRDALKRLASLQPSPE